VPQVEVPWEAYGTHVLPLQQPPGQELASHTHAPLPLHSWPGAQEPHAAPPVPQELLDSET
jgi:hypothetical protein